MEFITKAGIYRWRNITNNHCYIGSSDRLKKRYSEQVNDSSCPRALRDAINRYGIESFIYEIVEPIENINNLTKEGFRKYLYEREQVWLDMYYAQEYILSGYKNKLFKEITYNIRPLVDNATGSKWSEESKKKRSEKYSKNHPRTGMKMTEEQIRIMSDKFKKIGMSKGEKNPNYGKKSTPEKRAKYLETKKQRGSVIEFYRIDKELKIEGPFYGVSGYAKDNKLEPRGISYCIFEVERCRKYKEYTYCLKSDIEKRIELIGTHPNFWRYHKFKKEYYQSRKNNTDGKV